MEGGRGENGLQESEQDDGRESHLGARGMRNGGEGVCEGKEKEGKVSLGKECH